MDRPVRVWQVVKVMESDPNIVEKWMAVADSLELKPAIVVPWKNGWNNSTLSTDQVIKNMLSAWIGTQTQATVGILGNILVRDHDVLTNLADRLVKSLGKNSVIEFGNNEMKEAIVQPHSNWMGELQITKFLGQGSFGLVLKALNTSGEGTALKIMLPIYSADPTEKVKQKEKEMREFENLAGKNHPNVVKCFRVSSKSLSLQELEKILRPEESSMGYDDSSLSLIDSALGKAKRQKSLETVCIQMELCGRDLRGWLDNPKPKLDYLKMNIAIGLISGLNYLHWNGVIHRDLKPENVYFSYNSQETDEYLPPIKIGDFGSSRRIDVNLATAPTLTVETGTALYRAPEMDALNGKYSNKVDYFSVGLIIWEVHQPISRSNLKDLFTRLVYRDEESVIGVASPVKEIIINLTKMDHTIRELPKDVINLFESFQRRQSMQGTNLGREIGQPFEPSKPTKHDQDKLPESSVNNIASLSVKDTQANSSMSENAISVKKQEKASIKITSPYIPPKTGFERTEVPITAKLDHRKQEYQPNEAASLLPSSLLKQLPNLDTTPYNQEQQPPHPLVSPAQYSSGPRYQALWDYEAQDVDKLSFKAGDVIVGCSSIDQGWLTGTNLRSKQRGMLPANYVQLENRTDDPIPVKLAHKNQEEQPNETSLLAPNLLNELTDWDTRHQQQQIFNQLLKLCETDTRFHQKMKAILQFDINAKDLRALLTVFVVLSSNCIEELNFDETDFASILQGSGSKIFPILKKNRILVEPSPGWQGFLPEIGAVEKIHTLFLEKEEFWIVFGGLIPATNGIKAGRTQVEMWLLELFFNVQNKHSFINYYPIRSYFLKIWNRAIESEDYHDILLEFGEDYRKLTYWYRYMDFALVEKTYTKFLTVFGPTAEATLGLGMILAKKDHQHDRGLLLCRELLPISQERLGENHDITKRISKFIKIYSPICSDRKMPE